MKLGRLKPVSEFPSQLSGPRAGAGSRERGLSLPKPGKEPEAQSWSLFSIKPRTQQSSQLLVQDSQALILTCPSSSGLRFATTPAADALLHPPPPPTLVLPQPPA